MAGQLGSWLCSGQGGHKCIIHVLRSLSRKSQGIVCGNPQPEMPNEIYSNRIPRDRKEQQECARKREGDSSPGRNI